MTLFSALGELISLWLNERIRMTINMGGLRICFIFLLNIHDIGKRACAVPAVNP